MKKLLFILILPMQFCFASPIKKTENNLQSQKSKVDPLACCTRRASSGTYGQSDYNQVSVTRCATSTESYQDAYARACVLAEASATRALEISEATSGPVIIRR
jgi:hypothetical protein